VTGKEGERERERERDRKREILAVAPICSNPKG
jgi:hypothetical protein